jgi:hypothetical protein
VTELHCSAICQCVCLALTVANGAGAWCLTPGLVKLSDWFESMEETRTVFTDSLTELLGECEPVD